MIFHFCMEAHELEHYVENVLIMHFTVAWSKFVWYIIEECLQTAQERIHITFAHVGYETLDLVWRLCYAHRCIIGKKETEKALLNLAVRKTQSVVLELFIITLYCQITALIDYRNRVGGAESMESRTGPLVTMSSISIQHCIREVSQLHNVCWRTGSKPVTSYLFFCKGIQQAEWIIHSV